MDEMKIKLSTRFMRGFISKIAMKMISSKLGIKPDILINSITFEKRGDMYHVHLSVDADIKEHDIFKLMELADKEETE